MPTVGCPQLHANNAEKCRAYRQRKRAAVLQVPCVRIGDLVTLYQGDARAVAAALQPLDAVITDPPYGTGFTFAKARRSRNPLQPTRPAARWSTNILGDDQPFDPTPWLAYPQVILWGGNFYAHRLPPAGAALVWDKRKGSTPDDHADCELAWTNLPGPARLVSLKWRGLVREGEANVANRAKLHPAEKPLELMVWCVEKTTGTVLDPYMGSGSTLAACVRLGRPCIWIELDPHYFQVAAHTRVTYGLPTGD
jgi:site-specific DNA-methyltransferase (adenine-specific)